LSPNTFQADTPTNIPNLREILRLGAGMSEATTARRIRSIPETMEQIPVGMTTLFDLINSCDLQRVKIKHRTFITQDSIDAYLSRIGA
jgi:hypothetical protein